MLCILSCGFLFQLVLLFVIYLCLKLVCIWSLYTNPGDTFSGSIDLKAICQDFTFLVQFEYQSILLIEKFSMNKWFLLKLLPYCYLREIWNCYWNFCRLQIFIASSHWVILSLNFCFLVLWYMWPSSWSLQKRFPNLEHKPFFSRQFFFLQNILHRYEN